ncbi:hypothetical protein caldi_29810 [Caldinitratiruptor microaerophilus]|uniref:Uncharacterized protein n=1 Tax=Caldinitratiruptor microaerophilus TaxID=671077 RepID=A0AA35G6U7_9FIRM|nr:hypothetical protein caldi_29810 [Caldinitratiruptor microaerophilus]
MNGTYSRKTVRYIEELGPSGSRYYRQELITSRSWRDPSSLYWTTPRPITERMFRRAEAQGFPAVRRRPQGRLAAVLPIRR